MRRYVRTSKIVIPGISDNMMDMDAILYMIIYTCLDNHRFASNLIIIHVRLVYTGTHFCFFKEMSLEDYQKPVDDDDEKSTSPPASSPSLLKIFTLSKPELPMLIVGLVLMLASESATQVIPLIVAKAYNAIINPALSSDEKISDINHYMATSVGIFAAATLAGFSRHSIFAIVGERLVARLRLALYRSILSQDISFFDANKSGELVSRLTSDTTLLQGVIAQFLPEALVNSVKAVASLVLMFWISPVLAGVSVGSLVGLFVLATPLGLRLGKLSKSYQDILGKAQSHSTESIGSIRTVQAFAGEAKEQKRYAREIGDPDDFPLWWWPSREKEPRASTYRVGVIKSLTSAAFFTCIFGGGFGFLYVCLWYGFYLLNQGELSLGDLTAFQSYVFNIGLGLGSVATNAARISEGLGASGRVFFLLERKPKIKKSQSSEDLQNKNKSPEVELREVVVTAKPESKGHTRSLESDTVLSQGQIAFEHVTFAYPSRKDVDVLHDFSLLIPAKSTTALVGSSGSGKSTVVALLQRFYDVTSGGIYLDGVNLQDLDLSWLRNQMGYVQQEPQLFGLSVRENLLYGVEDGIDVSDAELQRACEDANAHEFIMSWPEGYDTLVGERGVKCSGGQKQRIGTYVVLKALSRFSNTPIIELAIARALLTKCRILLLDEATSALDSEAEFLVQEAIDKAVIGRTVIIVAHRLSTIQRASQIVVMSEHTIVDVGSHDVLMRRCTKYQDLIKRQNLA